MVEQDSGSNIKVVCRFRPLNEKEFKTDLGVCAQFPDSNTVTVYSTEQRGAPLRFKFDYVFPPQTAQRDVYRLAAKPIVQEVMKGFNGTVFSYGQTSSGKTFTMTGPDIDDQEMMGIIPRMVTHVFQDIEESDQHIEYSVKVSYAQIYLEKIRDLLEPSKNNLAVHQDRRRGVYIADLTQRYVSSDFQVYDLMKIGQSNREVGFTQMNAGSSRSHSIFCITIGQNNSLDYSTKSAKLYLVDLAGSEKVGKTGVAGKRLQEAKNINKSLTTLGLVIFQLTDGKSKHVPYRNSKLTRVLQDSLGGNSKTSLIVTCSPSRYNEAETVSTLRFGIRAKAIKNRAKVNREYTVGELKFMLQKAKQEISKRDKRIAQLESSMKQEGSQVVIPEITEQYKKQEELLVQTEIQDNRTARDQLIMELEETRTRLSQEVQQHTQLKQKFVQMNDQYQSFSSEVSQLTHFCQMQQDTIENFKKQVQQNVELIQSLSANKESLESQVESLNFSKIQVQKELNKVMVENSELKSELEVLKTEGISDSSQEIINNLRQQILELQQKDLIRLKSQTEIPNKLEQSLPDIDSERQTVSLQNFSNYQAKWERQKYIILRDLQTRVEQVMKLEVELDTSKQKYRRLEFSLSQGQRAVNKRNQTLQKNIDQLTLMYHQIVKQRSTIKAEKQVNYKKALRLGVKNEKLQNQVQKLQEENKNLGAKLQEQQGVVKKLVEELEVISNQQPRMSVMGLTNRVTVGGSAVSSFTRNIRKTIRGRGDKISNVLSKFKLPTTIPEEEDQQF